VDVNTASAEEIAAATGIDLVRAQNIVDFRTTIGPFKALTDLKEVQGITDSVFALILPRVTLSPPEPTPRPAPAFQRRGP
jgi:competence protein ComEA